MPKNVHYECDNYVCLQHCYSSGGLPWGWFRIEGLSSEWFACSHQCLVEVAAKLQLGNVPMGTKVEVAINLP
jgi:hypothetical protein